METKYINNWLENTSFHS